MHEHFAFDINNTSTDPTCSYRAADIDQYFRQLSTRKSEKRAKGFHSVPYAARMAFSRLLTTARLLLLRACQLSSNCSPNPSLHELSVRYVPPGG
ncbi:hypothetical protein BDN67DRAFT_355325 [Paxillus ammoniavirescens]|nr:hypothetical protein BDN67DRAFT_355325 [Paxillus ammoniavirescens]